MWIDCPFSHAPLATWRTHSCVRHSFRQSALEDIRANYGAGMASSEVKGEAGRPAELYRFTDGALDQP